MSKEFRIEKTKIINNVLHAEFDEDSLVVDINLPKWDEDEHESEDEYWDKLESETTHYEYSIDGCINLMLEEDGDYTRGYGDDMDFIGFKIEGDFDWLKGHSGDFEISIEEDGNYGIFTGKQMAQIVWDVIYDQIPNISKQMLEELGNPPLGTRDFTEVVDMMLDGVKKEIFRIIEFVWDNR